jgi:hypothetical protein
LEVDGLDGQHSPTERNPGSVALACHCDCSIAHRESFGRREWHRADHFSRVHYRFVLGVRLFVFTHGMKAFPKQITAANAGWRTQFRFLGSWHRPTKVIACWSCGVKHAAGSLIA